MEARAGTGAAREPDLERFLTFLDASVAIALTLLVLPLVDVAADVRNGGSVVGLLGDHLPELASFLLSFVVIARLWYAQHVVVRHLVVLDARVFAILMAWTLTIVFLPFPTSLVAEQGHQAATKVLYIGTTALSMALLALLQVVMRRHHELADGSQIARVRVTVTNVLLLLVALAISVSVPALSYFPMLLLALDGRLVDLADRLRR